MHRIQRCIQKRRMARIARWRLVAGRLTDADADADAAAPTLRIVPTTPDATPSGPDG
jgi:hypothetical protein